MKERIDWRKEIEKIIIKEYNEYDMVIGEICHPLEVIEIFERLSSQHASEIESLKEQNKADAVDFFNHLFNKCPSYYSDAPSVHYDDWKAGKADSNVFTQSCKYCGCDVGHMYNCPAITRKKEESHEKANDM